MAETGSPGRSRARSRSFYAEEDDEPAPEEAAGRGRARSSSFVVEQEDSGPPMPTFDTSASSPAFEEDDAESAAEPVRGRSRSRSVMQYQPEESSQEESDEDVVARAASLSRIGLAGGMALPKGFCPSAEGSGPVVLQEKKGAVNDRVLRALQSPLAASDAPKALSEEEQEEQRLIEEEAAARTAAGRASLIGRTSLLPPSGPAASAADEVAPRSLSSDTTSSCDSAAGEVASAKIKLLLLGDSGVGKTSLMSRFSEDCFAESVLATAGVDFKTKTVRVELEDQRYDVACQLWDTAGQQRFHKITSTYYRSADGIVLVYDTTDSASFENISYWLQSIVEHASEGTATVLLGNKTDLPDRQVASAQGAAVAEEHGLQFFEVSAKSADNVDAAFTAVAAEALEGRIASPRRESKGGSGRASPEKPATGKKLKVGKDKCVVS